MLRGSIMGPAVVMAIDYYQYIDNNNMIDIMTT